MLTLMVYLTIGKILFSAAPATSSPATPAPAPAPIIKKIPSAAAMGSSPSFGGLYLILQSYPSQTAQLIPKTPSLTLASRLGRVQHHSGYVFFNLLAFSNSSVINNNNMLLIVFIKKIYIIVILDTALY
jgi:hypothetical protein